jgi:hypothetical protein
MPNEIFRRRLQGAVEDARRTYADAALVDHMGLRGRVREIVAGSLLTHVLPAPFEIGTGKRVDSNGVQSAETDVIVYSKSVLPPILYSARDGVFPAEACFLALEVKSCLTATELDNTIGKAKRLRELSYIPGVHSSDHRAISHGLTPVISALFSFESDLTGKSELDRYAERDPDWRDNPLVRAICVVGRGYFWFSLERAAWIVHPATDDSEEVVEFLALASNTCVHSLQRRERPRLGKYLMTERRLDVVHRQPTSVKSTAITEEA